MTIQLTNNGYQATMILAGARVSVYGATIHEAINNAFDMIAVIRSKEAWRGFSN